MVENSSVALRVGNERRGRPVTLIGVNFSSKKRNIDIPAIESL